MNEQITAEKIIRWYKQNKRAFPWRDTGEPYDVWLSEIMLQQTRIPVILERFPEFKRRFPGLFSLANASEDEVLKEWEGLGYYSRARNLKKCAELLVKEYRGVFPKDSSELQKLPGIGPYTAAAIACITAYEKTPLIDGNVLRVISRVSGIRDDVKSTKTVREIRSVLTGLLDTVQIPEDVPALSVGIMELGEVVCKPGAGAECAECPLKDLCEANKCGLTDEIPFIPPKKPRLHEDKTVLIISTGEEVLLEKRPGEGLLANMWQPVMTEGHISLEEAREFAENLGLSVKSAQQLPDADHVFSHKEWHMRAYKLCTNHVTVPGKTWVSKNRMDKYAIPSAFSAFKRQFN